MSQKMGIVPTKIVDVVPNAASSYVGAKKVYKGDIVFNKLKAHLGVFAVSSYDGLVSPDYAVYESTGFLNSKLVEHLFHTALYIAEFKRHSRGVAAGFMRLYSRELFAIPCVLPPLPTQRAIVAYLDEKCGKVDRLVAAKEKEAALLKELKQSMIAEAVTHGVRSGRAVSMTPPRGGRGGGFIETALPGEGDLSAAVSSKPPYRGDGRAASMMPPRSGFGRRLVPSGIPWLPEVPEGWEMKKVRQHFRLRVEKVSEKDYPPLSVAKIGVVPQLSDVALSMAEGDTRKLVRAGDYVVNSRSDRKGSCGIAPRDGSVTTISIVLEPRDIERKFVHYLFRSTP